MQEQFKDVGLMTGDVTINPSASCIVMTTEVGSANECDLVFVAALTGCLLGKYACMEIVFDVGYITYIANIHSGRRLLIYTIL